ncbi:MAG: 4-(cytidine 5'-diphospho)-2-C-methyl-D-erythritol kinase [Chitinophagaceae bacterium]|nr:4-(cytidine 5'-diphospho)-2-C-methyl-D-erythritol kinase [Chitinophagaceae bacterium]
MVVFPNCKINLGLHITRKREDGYHDLETVFYPVGITDVLEIISNSDKNSTEPIQYSASGLSVNGSVNTNLCVKAYHLLKLQFPQIPPIKMHLHKNIPMGAGLGGGSADGAFTLQLLNHKYQLELSEKELIDYALKLGSDCPFFIINKACIGKGRGEILEEISLNLLNYRFLIVNPGIHIATSWAFSNIVPAIPKYSIETIIREPIAEWKKNLVNDFEKPVVDKYPEIGHIINSLYAAGATYAALSGSGSTVFGIFEKDNIAVPKFSKPYYIKLVN